MRQMLEEAERQGLPRRSREQLLLKRLSFDDLDARARKALAEEYLRPPA